MFKVANEINELPKESTEIGRAYAMPNGELCVLIKHDVIDESKTLGFKIVDIKKKKNKVPKALKILKKAFKDKSPGSYYDSWVSNIAVSFYDECSKKGIPNMAKIRLIANDAAENFLSSLLK
ncbi:MAG: hypothetical protein WC783_04390 [Candidatus Paceibacterota bacterium]|jgi:hypothetical protein